MQPKAKEPTVISMHLLRATLDAADAEDAPPGEPPRPPVALPDATALRISFRGLLRIQNLDCLRSLKRLHLDNNNITRIEGLDCLAGTLEWLDLSFNAIASLEGLAALTRLTDLSLYNNRITEVSGLSACTSLQCASLGNNLVEDLLATVLLLRKMPALEVLTLEGNPLCKQGEGGRDMYRPYCFAFCPRLKYLDYQLVTDAERLAAREGGVPSEKLAEVEEADAAEALAKRREKEAAEQLADYVAANLEVIETIVTDIFADEDAGALRKARPPPPSPLSTLALAAHGMGAASARPCPLIFPAAHIAYTHTHTPQSRRLGEA